MKVINIDSLHHVVYLNKLETKSLDFSLKGELEDYFKTLFLKLKTNHHMEMTGYYNISVYTDPFYGAVLELEKEEVDYFNYFDNQVDMRITVSKKGGFLYQLDDYLDILEPWKAYGTVYTNLRHCYFKLEKRMPKKHYFRLLEMSDLKYKEVEEIELNGKIISA